MSDQPKMPSDIKVLNWLGIFFYGIFVVIIVFGLIIKFAMNKSFALNGISIRGDILHHSATSLRESVVPNLKGNFYTISLSHTQRVFEVLPWISKASVKRVFPQQIEVVLVEHKAVAVWGARDDSKMVNDSGVVFDSSIDNEESETLPQFLGPEGQSALVLNMYQHLGPIFMPLNLKLTKLELSERGSWHGVFEGGALIELGRGTVAIVSDRAKRFAQTMGLVASKFNRGSSALLYADLRHPDGYALRLNGLSTVGNPAASSLMKQVN